MASLPGMRCDGAHSLFLCRYSFAIVTFITPVGEEPQAKSLVIRPGRWISPWDAGKHNLENCRFENVQVKDKNLSPIKSGWYPADGSSRTAAKEGIENAQKWGLDGDCPVFA
jgi:hypothetical protein